MQKACVGCSKKSGLQKTVEISRLSPYIAVQVEKADLKQNVNYAVKLNLEKYTRQGQKVVQSLVTNQNSCSFELVALICETFPSTEETKDYKSSLSVLLKHNNPLQWVKYTFGNSPQRSTLMCEESPEELTNDTTIKFALYRKETQPCFVELP